MELGVDPCCSTALSAADLMVLVGVFKR